MEKITMNALPVSRGINVDLKSLDWLLDGLGSNPVLPAKPQQPQLKMGIAPDCSTAPLAEESISPVPKIFRVLLLEDNVILARMMKRHFEIEGFHVTMVHLGHEALRLLEEQQFHLALVDIDLPDTTGFSVMARAAERGRLDNTKIIFCSGDPSPERVELAAQFKGSLFLGKPFPMGALLSVVRSLRANGASVAPVPQ